MWIQKIGSDGMTYITKGKCSLFTMSYDTTDDSLAGIDGIDKISEIKVGIAIYDSNDFGKENRDKFLFDEEVTVVP